MSIDLGSAVVSISADASSLTSALTGAQGSIGSFASGVLGQLGPVGAALGIAAGAALGVGVASVKMAGDFSSSVTSLVTGAGESVKNVDMIKQGLLDLSVQTATPTKNLVDGLYMIESAGYHGAAGLAVLKAAAEGAKVGNADLGTVSNALTTILTDYHLSADQATGATNALVQTVADGKTHMQDLASALGSVLPLASSLGISLPQVAGGLAVMTNAGMSAQRASANLANAIRSLAAPNSSAVKSMQAVGLTAQQLKDTLSTQGLTGAIQLVEEHVNSKFPAGSVQAVQAFKAIMGGATGYNVALMLGGKNMAAYESNVKNITAAMNSGKNGVQGWALVQQDFNFKLQQAQQAVNVLMIRIGSALLPVVTQLIAAVTPLILRFADWISKSGDASSASSTLGEIVKQVGSFIQTQLIPPFLDLYKSIVPLLPELTIAAQALGVVLVGAIGVLGEVLKGLVIIFTGVIQTLAGLIAFFVDLFTGQWGKLGTDLQTIWHGMLNMLVGLLNALFPQMVQSGRNLIQGFINGIMSMVGAVGNAASSIVSTVANFLGFHSPAKEGPGAQADTWAPNLLKMFQTGLEQGQPALQATLNTMLAPHVYPSGMPSGALATAGSTTGGGSSQPLHISLHIDGHQVGQALVNDMRLRTGVRL